MTYYLATPKLKILLIEDNPGDARLVWEMLQDDGNTFDIVSSDNLSVGLEEIAKNEPDVILLDLGLPDSQGLETFQKVNDQTSSVPVIVFTVSDDDDLAIGAVQLGAQDYLVKGQIDGNTLKRSIGYAIERKRVERELHKRDRLFEGAVTASHKLLSLVDFNTAIDQALDSLGCSADVDIVFVLENIDDPKTDEHMLSHSFTWSSETHSVERDKFTYQNIFYDCIYPHAYETLLSGTPLKGNVRDFSDPVQKIFDPLNIASILFVPIIISGQLWGLIGFGDCCSARTWSDNEVSILFVAAGLVGGAIIRNINDEELRKHRNELEERVKERTLQLETKNAEMERFVYTVSHDLRSPLVTISGFVGFAKEDIKAGSIERAETDLEVIEDAAINMDRLLGETLSLSRIGRVASPPEDVPFMEVVQDALVQVGERIRAQKVDVSVEEDMPLVHVDKTRIVEVLVNLLENSMKYMGEQQKPEIEIGYCQAEETIFYIRDNGMGIDPDLQGKVFGLFYKIDTKSEGAGTGLAIVKRIIEVHGGRAWIESELGKGCTVCFTLPHT